jgi:hypothetical protein
MLCDQLGKKESGMSKQTKYKLKKKIERIAKTWKGKGYLRSLLPMTQPTKSIATLPMKSFGNNARQKI